MALGYIIIRSPYTPYSIYLRGTRALLLSAAEKSFRSLGSPNGWDQPCDWPPLESFRGRGINIACLWTRSPHTPCQRPQVAFLAALEILFPIAFCNQSNCQSIKATSQIAIIIDLTFLTASCVSRLVRASTGKDQPYLWAMALEQRTHKSNLPRTNQQLPCSKGPSLLGAWLRGLTHIISLAKALGVTEQIARAQSPRHPKWRKPLDAGKAKFLQKCQY